MVYWYSLRGGRFRNLSEVTNSSISTGISSKSSSDRALNISRKKSLIYSYRLDLIRYFLKLLGDLTLAVWAKVITKNADHNAHLLFHIRNMVSHVRCVEQSSLLQSIQALG